MQKRLKILVVRFGSIGDIILTTPVIRCLKSQLNVDLDFLTKRKYKDVLKKNSNIRDVLVLSDSKEDLLSCLRSNNYDYIIDLQNNFRSLRICLALRVKTYRYEKNILKRYLLIYFGINLLNNHVVDRYFNTVNSLNIVNDRKGLDYFVEKPDNLDFNFNQEYLTWSIGGTHEPKRLSVEQISSVLLKLDFPVLLLGSKKEKHISQQIINNTHNRNIYDFCGKTSISESAFLIKNSKGLLTNDTGMMHIASAFLIPIISFWGCTKPSLGFSPYMPHAKSEQIISSFSKNPCSKHGRYCKFKRKGCVKEISSETIYNAVIRLLK